MLEKESTRIAMHKLRPAICTCPASPTRSCSPTDETIHTHKVLDQLTGIEHNSVEADSEGNYATIYRCKLVHQQRQGEVLKANGGVGGGGGR